MNRRPRWAPQKRSLSQRLGNGNILSNGMLHPVSPTDMAIFEMKKRAPSQHERRNQ